MEKMTGKSLDLVAENVKQLKRLFPEAVTEGKIDFEVLKNMLGGEIEDRQEYYKFTWNGKEAARAYARIPSMGTLRPCVEESSGKDGTPGKFDSENLYIEGDNLEVLKLLQGAYHKKVKMIYIDPPYNTGKDFIYPDNYRNSIDNYKTLTGQIADNGGAARANPETSGRYHTDWLNMMYPRLILARNLLTDDGVMFISIDDTEVDNLKKICNEVFGEENYVANLVWQSRTSISNDYEISNNHNHTLAYSKSRDLLLFGGDPIDESEYINPDSDPRGPWKLVPIDANHAGGDTNYPIRNPKTGIDFYPPNGRIWCYNKATMQQLIADGRIKFGLTDDSAPKRKLYLQERIEKGDKKTPSSLIVDNSITTKTGTVEIMDLFDGEKVFDYPKPVSLINKLIQYGIPQNGIVMDFFSGSGTTAAASLVHLCQTKKNIKYICIQLPENLDVQLQTVSPDAKKTIQTAINKLNSLNLPHTLCEIGKERIRRAAKIIKKENPLFPGDIGFKVFKLDTSNIIPWNPDPDNIELTMRNAVENMIADRTRQDLLYEVLLKCNLPLTLPIEENKFGSNTVYIVGAGALAICLDQSIPQTIAEEIVKLRDKYAPIVPMQVVFRDNGFTDVAKTNALQILKQAGFEEKSIQTI